MEKIVKKEGITFHLVHTDKYKTNTIVFKMKAPLQGKDATLRALLPHVLQSGTNTYPTATELRTYLEQLYGATLNVDLQKKGEYHIISFSLEVANEKYLSEKEPLLQKALQLLYDVLINPKRIDNGFDPSITEKEKRTLKQRIQTVYDDKMRYANMRLIEEMCKDEPYAVNVNGIFADVDPITPQILFNYYERALAEDQMDLYIVGDFEEDEVLDLCEKWFSFSARKGKVAENRIIEEKREERVVIERQDVLQGKLNIGYRTNVTYGDDDYFALQVFNGLFGGFPHSKLFVNVRERASLAYYAVSRLESHKGLMMVMTGIEPKNYERALSIIKEQLQGIKNGDFTDEELAQTKAVIQNQMLETLDTSRGLVEVLYHNVISQIQRTEDMWMEKIQKVEKEDVLAVAKKIRPDTVYFLTGMEG